MSEKILTSKQIQKLTDANWNVVNGGAYLTLYADDFTHEDTWIQICQQLNVDWNSTQKIDVLYFGTQTNS